MLSWDTMKRELLRLALIAVLLAAFPPVAFAAAGGIPSSKKEDVLKRLETNRAMLSRFEAEYALLEQLERDKSPAIRRELTGLKYKIEALRDETKRASSALSEDDQAGEFMKDVVAKVTMTGARNTPPGAVRPTDALHEKALALVSERRLTEAATVYEEILLADPEDDQAYLILGHVRLLSGAYDRAEEAFLNAVHIDQANINEILPFYENLVLEAPMDDTAHSNLGYACLIVGDFVRAKQTFRSALQIRPSNADALRGLEIAEERI